MSHHGVENMIFIPRLVEGLLTSILRRAIVERALASPHLTDGSRSRRRLPGGGVIGQAMNDLQRWQAMAVLAQEGEEEKATLASFVGSLCLLKAIVDNEDNPAVLHGLLSFYEEPTGDAAAANALRIARPIVQEATRRGIFPETGCP